MPQRIVTLEQMRSSRESIAFCYLCGTPLSGATVQSEHIFPQSLRGPAPPLEKDRWTPVLPVHSRCEKEAKRDVDQLVGVLLKL
ncbi:MAG TPA: hypothetical protein VHC70_07420, partial [Phycisphaerales bacterium]|nr:hypothetical protein [Phycisphaerales bacterium]